MFDMKEILRQLILSFHETPFRELMPRMVPFTELAGKAMVVVGMRRAGKTSYCVQNLQTLMASVPKERMLYINFENIRLLEFTWKDFPSITEVYYGMFPEHKNRLCYFVFDEIQRIEHWESFIRGLLDEENVCVILTGSSSKLLSTEIATSLRGRALTTEIFPFSFEEFMRFHRVFETPPSRIGNTSAAKMRKAMSDYFQIGGFPECQAVDADIRERIQQDYVEAVVFRDVVERHRVSNVKALKNLVSALLNSVGQRFSVSKFSATLSSMGIKCSREDLHLFLDYLADAFLVFKVPVYSHSVRVGQVNPVKIYAIDVGLVRANVKDPTANRGALLENLVYLHLRRQGLEIAYGTTENGGEIDFIVSSRRGAEMMLVQVSYSLADTDTRVRELGAFKSVASELKKAQKVVVTWDEEGHEEDVEIVPVWKFISCRDVK